MFFSANTQFAAVTLIVVSFPSVLEADWLHAPETERNDWLTSCQASLLEVLQYSKSLWWLVWLSVNSTEGSELMY